MIGEHAPPLPKPEVHAPTNGALTQHPCETSKEVHAVPEGPAVVVVVAAVVVVVPAVVVVVPAVVVVVPAVVVVVPEVVVVPAVVVVVPAVVVVVVQEIDGILGVPTYVPDCWLVTVPPH
jgi:hypothetical protein